MAVLTRFQALSVAGANYAFFVLLLALDVLHVVTLSPPWDAGIAWWVVANTVALGANAFAARRTAPQIVPNSCPYCGKALKIGLLTCDEHGDLVLKKRA